MNARNVYVDSNVFIGPILYVEPGLAEGASGVLRLIEGGKITAHTSTLTWDEVVWVVRKVLGKPDAVEAGKKLLGFPNLRFVAATEEVLRGAQRLVSDAGMAPRDAVHLASAQVRRVDLVISDDADLDAASGVKRETPSAFMKRK